MKRWIVTLVALAFSIVETFFVLTAAPVGGPGGTGGPGIEGALQGFLVGGSVPLSIIGWVAVGLSIFSSRPGKRARLRSFFENRGFSSEVYDLMVKTRGRGSRLLLLRTMETPKHRNELSEVTGIDWKEVDRQIGVLQKFGLVTLHAQSGAVRLYQITEQGRLLLRIIDELNLEPSVQVRDHQADYLLLG